ncbi:MAG: TlpA family protein disulfide reductase [Ktedonobacterales bacterium]
MKRLTLLCSHMTPARWLQTAVVAIALFSLLLAVAIRAGAGSPSVARRIIGLPAPAFSLQAESHGQVQPGTISLASERGHTVLLVFMYSLCPHCLNQIEAVQELETQKATDGLRILYIDSPAESAGIISAYAERLGIESPATPILLDPNGALAQTYGIVYYPTTVLIDARGIVRQVWTGETTSDSLSSAIKLLAQRSPFPAPPMAGILYE